VKTPPVFENIKEDVLGKRYDLSLAFLSPAEMKKITFRTKGKRKASNVLAFPLSKTSGEILICPDTAKKEAKDFHMNQREFLAYLFIHGLLHLKGHAHSATMESAEQKLLTRFQICKK
jgi:probable rRNA maturation factor